MNIWNKIDEPVMRAVGNVICSIWGQVGFSIAYEDKRKELALTIWDKSYTCEDKEIVVNKIFSYEIKDTTVSTILDIVEMIEKYLVNDFS